MGPVPVAGGILYFSARFWNGTGGEGLGVGWARGEIWRLATIFLILANKRRERESGERRYWGMYGCASCDVGDCVCFCLAMPMDVSVTQLSSLTPVNMGTSSLDGYTALQLDSCKHAKLCQDIYIGIERGIGSG